MDTKEARAMLIAIALQESKLLARRQYDGGPAPGFWQFEKGGGTKGVLNHTHTRAYAIQLCHELRYEANVDEVFPALQHNDVLACGFARLLLWTLPGLLARQGEEHRGWSQYTSAWRPGAPRPDDWPGNFAEAWKVVTA